MLSTKTFRPRTLLLALAIAALLTVTIVRDTHLHAAPPANAADAGVDEAFRADILRMMTITGSDKLGEQMLFAMIEQLKPMAPQVPEEFWTAFGEEVDMDVFIEGLVPIYAKHLTHDDIKGIIAFYESPAG